MVWNQSPAWAKLKELYAKRAIAFGEFTLASGQKSSYYINSKKVLMHGESLLALGELLYEATCDLPLDGIGGPAVGAIPMAAAAVQAYHQHGREVEGFFVREKAKDHGAGVQVEGSLPAQAKVVLIEDVFTTGGSALKALKVLEAAGHQVLRVICIVDRLQGAREAFTGYDYCPLFTIRDFGIAPVNAS